MGQRGPASANLDVTDVAWMVDSNRHSCRSKEALFGIVGMS